MENEPTDSSVQHFPANNILPFVQGDKENGLISASDHSNFISVSKWAFSCVSFCTVSKFFCHRFIFVLLFTKMPLTFFFLFGTWSGAFCPLHFTLAHTPIVQERWYFPFGLLDKCWYSWLVFTKARHSILMDFKNDSVYVSIIPTVDAHGWLPLHWEENTVLCRNYTSGSLGACHLLGTVPWVIG